MKYLVIGCLFLTISFGSEEYSTQYNDCIDKSEGVTSVMLNCIADETNHQDKLLNINYKKVMLMLDKEKKLELKKAQRL